MPPGKILSLLAFFAAINLTTARPGPSRNPIDDHDVVYEGGIEGQSQGNQDEPSPEINQMDPEVSGFDIIEDENDPEEPTTEEPIIIITCGPPKKPKTDTPPSENPSTVAPTTGNPSTVAPPTENPSTVAAPTENPKPVAPTTEKPPKCRSIRLTLRCRGIIVGVGRRWICQGRGFRYLIPGIKPFCRGRIVPARRRGGVICRGIGFKKPIPAAIQGPRCRGRIGRVGRKFRCTGFTNLTPGGRRRPRQRGRQSDESKE